MRVFVAGAAGVIGQRLVPLLTAAGHEVTGTTRSAARETEIQRLGAISCFNQMTRHSVSKRKREL